MRTAALVAFLALLCAGAAAESAKNLTDKVEAGITFGAEDGVGYEAWAPAARLSLSVGSDMFRVRGSSSWAGVHKGATPGGYSVGASWSGEVQFDHAHAFAGVSYHFTDQAVWTKRVRYAFGGVGWRWSLRWTGDVPREIVNAELSYSQEIFSTYANGVKAVQAGVTYDYRLHPTGPLCVRVFASLGGMWFRMNPYPGAEKSQGTSFAAGIGLAWRQ